MKRTPIFPPDVLPVRSGVYWTQNIDPFDGATMDPWGYSYFDATDRIWGCTAQSIILAGINRDFEFAHQTKQWQGVLEEAA